MELDSTYYKKQYFIQYLYKKVQTNIITILQHTLIWGFYCYSYFIVIISSSISSIISSSVIVIVIIVIVIIVIVIIVIVIIVSIIMH